MQAKDAPAANSFPAPAKPVWPGRPRTGPRKQVLRWSRPSGVAQDALAAHLAVEQQRLHGPLGRRHGRFNSVKSQFGENRRKRDKYSLDQGISALQGAGVPDGPMAERIHGTEPVVELVISEEVTVSATGWESNTRQFPSP